MEMSERKYDIASVGVVYWKSLELFASRLENLEGEQIDQSALTVGQRFWVIFLSGNGFTRTSAKRVC